jgi:hypothetical protein
MQTFERRESREMFVHLLLASSLQRVSKSSANDLDARFHSLLGAGQALTNLRGYHEPHSPTDESKHFHESGYALF